MIGYIYKLYYTLEPTTAYIGSTTGCLCCRLKQHKSASKHYQNRKLYKSIHELGANNFNIELIETFKYDNIDKLYEREGDLIKEYGTLNTNIAGHKWTGEEQAAYMKDYKQKNPEKFKAYNHTYYESHKLLLNEKFDCECGGRYTSLNKRKHEDTSKHLLFIKKSMSKNEMEI
jgi:hypothetical protein